MFTIQNKSEAGFEKIILKNDSTGNYASVIPACGAILNEFVVIKDGQSVNVIESYDSYEEFKNQVEEKGFKGCKLSPFVCRLNNAKYTFGEKEYAVKKYIPGKHALHGLIYDRPFSVLSQNANELEASVTMKYEYRSDDAGYPFNYDCIVIWQLEAENK